MQHKQQIRHRIKRNNRQIDTNNIGFTVNRTIINKKNYLRMKKVFLYGLPLMVAGSIYCSAANAADVIATSKNTKATSEV